MDYILQTSQIVKKYNNFTALTGLNMNVPRGSIYGFVGRNGGVNPNTPIRFAQAM